MFISEHNQYIFTDLACPNYSKTNILLLPPAPSLFDRIRRKLKLTPSFATQQLDRHSVDLLHYPGTTIDQLDVKTACVVT
ncbi:MAG: hypothetical protein H3C48_20145, partial [Chitinophagaceae bacterium]|nr:hypothetical protein [Chitinophagaceae bacterium]